MKKIANIVAVVLITVPGLLFAQLPEPDELRQWNMGIEKRVTDLENGHKELKDRVTALEKVTNDWNQGVRPSTTPGHDIIRGPDAADSGEGAPVLTNEAVIELYIKHEADISKIWKALPDEKSMRDAVELYLKMKAGKVCDCILSGKCKCDGNCKCPGCPVHRCVPPEVMKDLYKDEDKTQVTPSGLENQDGIEFYGVSWKGSQPTNKGRELLFFTSTDCVHCPAAGERLKPLTKDIYLIDCTEEGGPGHTLAGMHRVNSYPTLIAIDDGIKVNGLHTEGSSVGTYLASKWLTKEEEPHASTESADSLRYHMRTEHGYGPSKLAKMSDAEVKAAHDSLHVPKTTSQPKVVIRKSAPSTTRHYSSPTAYASPSYSSAKSVVRYGGSTWTWPGNLRQHLESTHGVNTAGLSDSQLRTVHDNLHNTGRSGITGGSYSSMPAYTRRTYVQPRSYGYSGGYSPTQYFSSGYSYGSSCPGGVCPN